MLFTVIFQLIVSKDHHHCVAIFTIIQMPQHLHVAYLIAWHIREANLTVMSKCLKCHVVSLTWHIDSVYSCKKDVTFTFDQADPN